MMNPSLRVESLCKGLLMSNVVAGTANFHKFNDNDCITSKNPDCVVVALRKLPIPVYPAKRPVANPLICVQPSSLPLKQDFTRQSCANLVKRIRNPLGVRSTRPARDDSLNDRQRSINVATSNSEWSVPQQLHVASSFSLRTLLIEDVWRLAPGTPVNVFSRLSGGPTRNPRFDGQWLKVHATTKQGLPNLKGPGKAVYFRQVQGYVVANPRQHDILGRHVTDLVEILTNTFQPEGIIVRCPAGPTGKDYNLLLTFSRAILLSNVRFPTSQSSVQFTMAISATGARRDGSSKASSSSLHSRGRG
jgi:hypothetical protein